MFYSQMANIIGNGEPFKLISDNDKTKVNTVLVAQGPQGYQHMWYGKYNATELYAGDDTGMIADLSNNSFTCIVKY